MSRRSTIMLSLLGLAVFLSSCAGKEPEPTSVTNPQLGIQLAVLPADLQVIANEAGTLVLAPLTDPVSSRITFEAGPDDAAPNLVAMLKADQARVEGLPDGKYQGGQELQTQFGTAFYSRGRFTADGMRVEETRVFGIHPLGGRVLKLSYRYPAGDDSARRVTRLLDLYAQIEAFTPAQ